MRTGLALSAALHAALAAALLLPWAGTRALPVPLPPLEVELVQASTAGADPRPPAMPEAPAAPPLPALPAGGDPAPPPQQQQQQPVPPRPAAPAVNLGNGGMALADLDARSDDVVPPRPDSRHRNLPPAYPAEAIRRRQAGIVRLLVHITADGIPLLVEVAGSSGHPSLDQAAVLAVEAWRFNPARGASGPVPYDLPLSFNFIGDRK